MFLLWHSPFWSFRIHLKLKSNSTKISNKNIYSELPFQRRATCVNGDPLSSKFLVTPLSLCRMSKIRNLTWKAVEEFRICKARQVWASLIYNHARLNYNHTVHQPLFFGHTANVDSRSPNFLWCILKSSVLSSCPHLSLSTQIQRHRVGEASWQWSWILWTFMSSFIYEPDIVSLVSHTYLCIWIVMRQEMLVKLLVTCHLYTHTLLATMSLTALKIHLNVLLKLELHCNDNLMVVE